jgi:hypothetical protein
VGCALISSAHDSQPVQFSPIQRFSPSADTDDGIVIVTETRSGRARPQARLFRLEKVAVMRTIEDVLNHLRAEYLEMPGLRLKPEQVQRLCGLERTMCQLALDSLLESNFLCLKPDGAYARTIDGADYPHPHDVKALLETGKRSARAS